ncbi:Molybdenum-pterin-binding protein MopA [Burkholderiales bacterium]|nr:Molybdenum-pterin-binding protein MopA [Burkholderiales bacterium]
MAMPRSTPPTAPRRAIRPRVYLEPDASVGPGKIDLLRRIDATRSISAAARSMGMSYKRAWQLVDALNRDIGAPVVATATGGRGGGGASLTERGRALVDRYAALEDRLNAAAAPELASLQALVRRTR